MNNMEFMKRYEGSPWHRIKLLLRGMVGLLFAIPMVFFTLLMVLLEYGNVLMDLIAEDSELGENSE